MSTDFGKIYSIRQLLSLNRPNFSNVFQYFNAKLKKTPVQKFNTKLVASKNVSKTNKTRWKM